MHKVSTEKLCKNSNEGAINCNGGEWTNPTGKIGLMYVSDYALSLGSSALALTVSTDYSTLKTGWMHQSNNDTTKNTDEWTLSRGGASNPVTLVWFVKEIGHVYNFIRTDEPCGVRPVFYLTTDTKVSSGNGTLDNPFIF